MAIQAQKGTKDMLPGDAYKWNYIERKLREISAEYGIREIRTPMFEATELFERGVGETTDVVQKEMYTFEDKGGRSITLKPEGTAPTVRAFIENSLYADAQPTKVYYFTDCFRYEKMQKGRLRQFHQYGIEVFGSQEPSIDAELISLVMRVLNDFGIEGLSLNINSLGCPTCRAKYNEALKEYLKANYENLCGTCKTRFEKNPMRIIDCKEKSCKQIVKDVPIILDFICDECNEHFSKLKNYLDIMGIQYNIDPQIVRGLDYYSKTVFEIIKDGLTLCGGGRYDYLVKEIGGPDTPAMGFALGLERLLLTLEEEGIQIPMTNRCDVYIGAMGDIAKLQSMKLAFELRKLGVKAEIDHLGKSVKAQMKYANKIGAQYTFVIGDSEIEADKINIKRMSDGEQFQVSLSNIQEIANIVK
ncbi:histidine--tRNA ligase [Clostridium tarantellae]|uniref:Histidine--tRNA ligase n=1 Tax=Clostridium tarantellae TaxID=39493 RepID=A0A6I1ML79_9CLOT|nr:histidine--tRNA ligase [Clostridium tarantellae]MPQ42982.1 histidine--tRNA ligase [Clostridium tarantellae]